MTGMSRSEGRPVARGGTPTPSDRTLLSVRSLVTEFPTPEGRIRAVDGVDFDVRPGEILGLVGESGSGKSTLAMSIVGLLQPPGRITAGDVFFEGRNLLRMSSGHLRDVRGKDIGVVFQDPLSSLNPVLKIGQQIREVIEAHDDKMRKDQIARRVIDGLRVVGVPAPEAVCERYPFELSGGMRQRVMIAIACSNNPKLLIADEPTTALDVTTQMQVIAALKAAQEQTQAATILITHNLALVAELADRVAVMYAGHIVETGEITSLFAAPRHPYTVGLMRSLPRVDRRLDRLVPIPGNPPSLMGSPGCPFQPRCGLSRGREICVVTRPILRGVGIDHLAACHFSEEMPPSAGGREISALEG